MSTTLLIDDDPFLLRLLARQLAQLGHADTRLCERAEDALLVLADPALEIGLVFCDLQMPGMDGVQFVRHLAQTHFRGGLVLVSGEQGRILQAVQMLAQAHHIHVLGCLEKPVRPEHLQRLLSGDANCTVGEEGASPASDGAGRAEPPLPTGDELRAAIAGGELVNHYQPKVDMATGALIGVEALVRWVRPQAGLVYPDRFIGLAEDNGLIDPLTQVVLATALQQVQRWDSQGLVLQMAVNVSMDNLAALDFPEAVAALAEQSGVPLKRLVLEVTESRLMKDLRAPLDILTRLRLKRVGLSIDDFGTGHSSLAQLRDIPFDELKLDRSFVNGAAQVPALQAIVTATLAMAGQLGMKVVAEGVETRQDWDFLRALGCNVAQGYFIGRPMPGDVLPAWCLGWRQRCQEMGLSDPVSAPPLGEPTPLPGPAPG